MTDTRPRPYFAIALWLLVALAFAIGGTNKHLQKHAERERSTQYADRCLTPAPEVLRDFRCTVIPSEFQPRLSTPQG